MRKLILSPYIGCFIFVLQIVIWLIFMPDFGERINIINLPYKYFTVKALILYLILFVILFIGIWFGKKIKLKTRKINYRLLYKYNTFLFFIWLFAEINSCKIFLKNPIEIINLLLNGQLGDYTHAVRDTRNISEPLVNLFPLMTTNIFLMLAKKIKVKSNKIQLLVIFLGVIINGLFVFKRMHFIYFFMIILIFYLKKIKKIKLKFYIFLFVIIALVILGEWLRYGVVYSKVMNLPLFSSEVFIQIIKYLMTAYLANDYNNTLIILDSPPSYQFISTGSPIFKKIILLFKDEVWLFSDSDKWSSGYGTVNSLGLWWFDWGEFTPIICIIIGIFIGSIYKNASKLKMSENTIQMIAPTVMIANMVFFRFNIFFQTIILIPLFFYIIFILLINKK